MDIQNQNGIVSTAMAGAAGAGIGAVAGEITKHSRINTIKRLTKDEFQRTAQEIKNEKSLANLPECLKSKKEAIKCLKEKSKNLVGKYALIGAAIGVGAMVLKSLFFNKAQYNRQYASMPQNQNMQMQQIQQQAPRQMQQQYAPETIQAQEQIPQQIQQVQQNEPSVEVSQLQTPQVELSHNNMLQQVQQMQQETAK